MLLIKYLITLLIVPVISICHPKQLYDMILEVEEESQNFDQFKNESKNKSELLNHICDDSYSK